MIVTKQLEPTQLNDISFSDSNFANFLQTEESLVFTLNSLASECNTMVQCVENIHELCMALTSDLNIKFIYLHHGIESGKMFLLFDIDIPNFGIWVYRHATTCCVHY